MRSRGAGWGAAGLNTGARPTLPSPGPGQGLSPDCGQLVSPLRSAALSPRPLDFYEKLHRFSRLNLRLRAAGSCSAHTRRPPPFSRNSLSRSEGPFFLSVIGEIPTLDKVLLIKRTMVEQLTMMCWFMLGILLPTLVVAAPPPINKLALFPDKSAWCEAKNITQIVGHTGCESKSIQNRACLGQCFSYSVPNTFPQSTESLVHCDSCMPAQSMWEIVKLECPGNEEMPRVDKLVEKIVHCSCQACGKEQHQDSQLFNVILNEEEASPPEVVKSPQIIHHNEDVALEHDREEE